MENDYILLQKKIDEIPVDVSLLDEDEMSRYDRLIDPAKKIEYLAGRCFLKREIAEMTNSTPENIQLLLSDNGKPYTGSSDMKFPHFNLSHSGGMVMIAFSKFPVGVDLEITRKLDVDALRPFLTPVELAVLLSKEGVDQQQSVLKLFTMKESFVKATDKKWGLDVIAFDWVNNAWQLQDPSIDCDFYLHETEKFTTSVCLVRGI